MLIHTTNISIHKLKKLVASLKCLSPVIFFYIFLFSILLLEGLGLPNGRTIARYIIIGFPFLLFLIENRLGNKILVPSKLLLFLLMFAIFVILSTIGSYNIQSAFEHQLFYLSTFLIFIYAYNHKKILVQYLPNFIITSTIIVLTYSVFIQFLVPDNLVYLIPITGFQFVYASKEMMSHHPIGAFILIPMIYYFLIYLLSPRRIYFLIMCILFSVLIFSFLRSAYISFFIVMTLVLLVYSHTKQHINIIKYIWGIVILLFLSFILVTDFTFQIPFISPVNEAISQKVDLLQYKSLLNPRIYFYHQALHAIEHEPLIGFGSFSFYNASMLFSNSYVLTTGTSHNIFLDIFAENGIIAGIVFTIIIGFILRSGLKLLKENNFSLIVYTLFLGLLILFQFGHYHKLYFLLTVFIFTAGLLYSEEEELHDKHYISLVAGGILFFFNCIILLSSLLLNFQMPQIARKIYPISTQAQEASILDYYQKGQVEEVNFQIREYYSLYPKDPLALDFIAYIKGIQGESEESIQYYESALQYSPNDLNYVVQIYKELENIKGATVAKQNIEEYFQRSGITNRNSPYFEANLWFYHWCEHNEVRCIFE